MHRGQYGGPGTLPRSPLVGRNAELERVDLLYENASKGRAVVVVICGEAGVGKTRLLEECMLHASTAARVARATCFEGLCPPFIPWRECFAMLGLADPFGTSTPMMTQAAAEMERYRSFVSAVEALRAAASAQPILITIDDLHWADFATIEFLAFAAARLRDARVLVLVCARSDDLESDHIRREALEKARHNGAVSISLEPLANDAMQQLLRNLQPPDVQIDAARLKRICALAEGKPYFAEELFSDALLMPADRALDAPLSIRAGVLARFDRLTPEERNVLLYAAVMGRSFSAPLLAGLAGVSIAQLNAALARSRDALLVREQSGIAGHFEFRHAITREILYSELLSVRAQTMHAEIARRLQTDPAADAVEIAHHWWSAGERAYAAPAFEAAGDEAAGRNAYRDAEAAYRRAANAAVNEADTRRAALYEKLCRACSINGDLKEACVWGQRAMDVYASSNDRTCAVTFALFLARRYADAGLPDEAVATVERALGLMHASDTQLRYAAHVTLARVESLRGRINDALRELAKAESVPGEHPLGERHLFYDIRADIRGGHGQLELALADCQQAIRLAREIGEAERLSITLSNYARFAFFAGCMSEAMAAYDEALALAERGRRERAAAIVATALAYVHLLTGDLEAAGALLGRHEGGGSTAELGSIAAAFRLAFLRDDDEAARRYPIDDVVATAFESNQPDAIGLVAGSVACYLEKIGKRSEADALRSRALQSITSANLSLWLLDQLAASAHPERVAKARELLMRTASDPNHTVAHAHLALFDARAAHQSGDSRTVKRHATEAADRFAAIGWPWERAQALELAGQSAEALEIYRSGGYVCDEQRLVATRRRARHRAGSDRLTVRELEVAQLAASGKSNREIAQALFIGERTVETHIAAIFDRFDLTSRHQLARILWDRERL